MKKIKEQLSELKKSTPRHIQWLLLIAALVIVVILITLLLTKKEEEKVEEPIFAEPLKLLISPETVDWSNTIVGQNQTLTVRVSANAPVKISGIRANRQIADFDYSTNTCVNIGIVDSTTFCTITLKYKPITAQTAEAISLFIDWQGVDAPETVQQVSKMIVNLGASYPEPVVVPEPEPVVQPEPEPIVEPEPVVVPEPEPVVIPEPVKEEPIKMPTESCFDFAIPGYNLSGVQSGWIKPEGGAYFYYPFSDTDCSDPTGVYNPDNGIITDIKNRAKKIGTDAEHIGYISITTASFPQLSNPKQKQEVVKALQLSDAELGIVNISEAQSAGAQDGGWAKIDLKKKDESARYMGSASGETVVSSMPYDRSFILRQFKPIPATLVTEILADEKLLKEGLPVRATVDRNVYADNGRVVILPAGTLMLGYVTGTIPGPYTTVGRMQLKWYQFIRPDGVEFNFNGDPTSLPFSGDSQGRAGVPGRGSTDYLEQFVMPMLTSIVPAAVNLIAPVADTFVNQIDLDNNTVVQSGTVRSSELAKNEIIRAWNQVAQKLIIDMADNSVPPFSIPAGTRMTVYSPTDLLVTCGNPNDPENAGKKCAISAYGQNPRITKRNDATPVYEDGTWEGQVRSFNMDEFCDQDTENKLKDGIEQKIYEAGYDYRTVLFYCQSKQYQPKSYAQQDALYKNQQQQFQQQYNPGGTTTYQPGSSLTGMDNLTGNQSYNENVLGLEYDDSGAIVNPFNQTGGSAVENVETVMTCLDGSLPDSNGCCAGEIFTDMGEQGFNCCPETGGDCFPPIK